MTQPEELAPPKIRTLSPLPKSFYLKPTPQVAQQLLGKTLVYRSSSTTFAAEIVEVEAYLGTNDPASHAFRGLTKRNWPMFEEGGASYVYLSYGVHFCMNVATGPKGKGEAVLFRAVRPLLGIEQMRKNRKLVHKSPYGLTNGPGKLTQAMGIDLSQTGLRFDREDLKIVRLGGALKKSAIGKSPRIGISQAREKLLRFYIKESPWISKRS